MRNKIVLFTFCSILTIFLIGCTSEERKKEIENKKELESANIAIDSAAKASQTLFETKFGLKFNMSRKDVSRFLSNKLNIKNVIRFNNDSFEYKYSNYNGLIAKVELFYFNDTLSRIAYQFKNKLEYLNEWSEEYEKFIGNNFEQIFNYYIPIIGVSADNSDKVFVGIIKNLVFIEKNIKYSNPLESEEVFIIENRPNSNKLPIYTSEKEKKQGATRFDKIKENELYAKTHKEEIEQRRKEYKKELENSKVQNSSWDGSVRQVEKYLKSSLKDPDSYESIEWSEVKQQGVKFIVRHKYRAKNSFGGYVVTNQVFTLNSNGEIIGVTNIE